MEPRHGLILVIDDEPAVADATQMMLELEGYEVLVAAKIGDVSQLPSCHVMSKPIDVDALLDRIQALLRAEPDAAELESAV